MDNKDLHNITQEDIAALRDLKSQIADVQEKLDTILKLAETGTEKSTVAPGDISSESSVSDAPTRPVAGVSVDVAPSTPVGSAVRQASQQSGSTTPSATPTSNVNSASSQGVPTQTSYTSVGASQAQYGAPVPPMNYGATQYYASTPQYSQPVYTAAPTPMTSASRKDHVAAALLAIFLGMFGVHKFYLGYNTAGFIMLAVTLIGVLFLFLPSFVVWIIGVIEGIVYLTKSQDEFDELYIRNKRLWF